MILNSPLDLHVLISTNTGRVRAILYIGFSSSRIHPSQVAS